MKVQRKVGRNRGKPRIWLEGAILVQAGLRPGDRYNLNAQSDTLTLDAHQDGKRKVSGKGTKLSLPLSDG